MMRFNIITGRFGVLSRSLGSWRLLGSIEATGRNITWELIQLSDGGIKVDYIVLLFLSCHLEHLAMVVLLFMHKINK